MSDFDTLVAFCTQPRTGRFVPAVGATLTWNQGDGEYLALLGAWHGTMQYSPSRIRQFKGSFTGVLGPDLFPVSFGSLALNVKVTDSGGLASYIWQGKEVDDVPLEGISSGATQPPVVTAQFPGLWFADSVAYLFMFGTYVPPPVVAVPAG